MRTEAATTLPEVFAGARTTIAGVFRLGRQGRGFCEKLLQMISKSTVDGLASVGGGLTKKRKKPKHDGP